MGYRQTAPERLTQPSLFDAAAALQDDCSAAAMSASIPCPTPPDALPPEWYDILRILEPRIGPTCTIAAPDLAVAAGIEATSRMAAGSRVRTLLRQHYRSLPWPVAATDQGYYRLASADDASAYAASLLGRTIATVERLESFLLQAARANLADSLPSQDTIRRALAHLRAIAH